MANIDGPDLQGHTLSFFFKSASKKENVLTIFSDGVASYLNKQVQVFPGHAIASLTSLIGLFLVGILQIQVYGLWASFVTKSIFFQINDNRIMVFIDRSDSYATSLV